MNRSIVHIRSGSGRLSCSVRYLMMIAVFLLTAELRLQAQDDEDSALPLTLTDQVVVRKEGASRTRTYSGVIEDLSGQNVVFRRNGNTVDVFRLKEVVTIRFSKSAEFDQGLRKIREQDWKAARDALQTAVVNEPRKWVVREIQASIAQSSRALGEFDACLEMVEKILKEDPMSRHSVELPLVWDERLPVRDRIQSPAADLKSTSHARQLTAASSLLQNPEHQDQAVATLQSLRKSLTGTMQDLAETQLWRLRLLQPQELRESEVEQWSQRVRYLDRRTRSGPEFLIGRALLLTHDYDNAATSLLWMPLLEPLDPATTRASISDAIFSLESSGRTLDAEKLRAEWPDVSGLKPAAEGQLP